MRKIILIDDDETSNYLSKLLIGSVSKEVQINSFTDPVEALSKIQTLPVDEKTVVLLDLNMPQMTGWEFLKIFENTGLKCRIIILTSSSNSIEKENAETNPMVSKFLTKPLTKDNVLEFMSV